MNNQICSLPLCEQDLYGSKAYVLGRLSADFNVPKGCALSTELYSAFLKENGFSYSFDDYYAKNEEIREFITKSNFSSIQTANIINALTNYGLSEGKYKYVVRSSATCEDQQKNSMAGIFESFINLQNFDEVFISIRECYKSLFSERALSHYEMYDFDLSKIKMSVIIQEYVEGQFSGVIFTADTKNHDTNSAYINYVQGKCSDFVDSNAQSYFIKMDKSTAKITDTNQPGEGACHLSDEIINQLLLTAVEIEKKLGYPSDIEWTYDGRNVYILQARPITTLKYERFTYEATEEDKKYRWFLAEQYPIYPLLEDFYRMSFTHRKEGIYRTGYGSQNAVIKQLNGYMYIGTGAMKNEKELREAAITRLKALTDNNLGIFHDVLLPKILVMKTQMDNFMDKELTNDEVADFLSTAFNYSNFMDTAHWDSVLGEEYIEEFHHYLKELELNISTEQLYNLIYCKTIKNKEREMLFNITDFIKEHTECAPILNSSDYPKIVYERLRHSVNWIELEKLIDDYIKIFGMQNTGERNNPANNLREKPFYIIDKIKSSMQQNSDLFYSTISMLQAKKEEEKSRILQLLSENKKNKFLEKLCLAEKTFASIDDHHYYCEDSSWGYVKTAISFAGNRLVKLKKLSKSDDVYYLKFDEIIQLLRNEISYIEISGRKEKYIKQEKMIPPQPLFIVHDTESQEPSTIPSECSDMQRGTDESQIILKGLSSLSKIVKGKILIGHYIPKQIEEECILVVRNGHGNDLFPVIGKVAGLIVSGGSPFDHMGIITREMNIPAIYYVSNAFDVLKTGDTVILNGEEGTISVL